MIYYFLEIEVTRLLQRAFEEASKLIESEQDALGGFLLNELASERCRGEMFAGSYELLTEQALAEYCAGWTEELDPDKL